MDTIELLGTLVGFETVSKDSNLPLLDFVTTYLTERGFSCRRVPDETGLKANLIASIGPQGDDGIILSGHTDVVPVAGQSWSSSPFRLRRDGDRLYGRGAADMKGFLAATLRTADEASRTHLRRPLHLTFSHDEEIGCVGVRSLLADLKNRGFKASLCIVGEPTSMNIGLGHKGKLAARATCRGAGGHSSVAPQLLNAIHLAADFVSALREEQVRIATSGPSDPDFDIAYSTIHAGKISGGAALNVVADQATVEFEIRHLAEDDPTAILARLQARAEEIVRPHRERFDHAAIEIDVDNAYLGFSISTAAPAVALLRSWLPSAETTKVSFGTEAGLYAETLDVPTIVVGPGSMEQGHRPDEYIDIDQLAACDAFLERLLSSLVQA
ncbi:MAG TPA: acetylornithine deacetylase [Rhizobium sp.]